MKALCNNCKREYEASDDDVYQDETVSSQVKREKLCPDCEEDLDF